MRVCRASIKPDALAELKEPIRTRPGGQGDGDIRPPACVIVCCGCQKGCQRTVHPLDPHVAAIGPTQVCKRLSERRVATLPLGIVFIAPMSTPMRRTRLPSCAPAASGHAAESGDELAPSKANAHLALPCEPSGPSRRAQVNRIGDRSRPGSSAACESSEHSSMNC